jgi:DNA-binding transcriptional regulator/RsmH inhibitor MraZ
MLIGEYLHTLDPKKRLSLPAKFRKELGRESSDHTRARPMSLHVLRASMERNYEQT